MPRDNSSPAVINFPLLDKLIIELDELLPSAKCKSLLFRIFNVAHGIDDIDDFCNGEGKPTRLVKEMEAC